MLFSNDLLKRKQHSATAMAPSAGPHVVKVTLDGDIRRIPVPPSPEVCAQGGRWFSALVNRIGKVYDLNQAETARLLLRYTDDDGDKCRITSDHELQEALRFAAEQNAPLRLEAQLLRGIAAGTSASPPSSGLESWVMVDESVRAVSYHPDKSAEKPQRNVESDRDNVRNSSDNEETSKETSKGKRDRVSSGLLSSILLPESVEFPTSFSIPRRMEPKPAQTADQEEKEQKENEDKQCETDSNSNTSDCTDGDFLDLMSFTPIASLDKGEEDTVQEALLAEQVSSSLLRDVDELSNMVVDITRAVTQDVNEAENDCKMAALQECMQPVVEAVSTKNPSVKAASAVMQVGEAVGTAMKLVRDGVNTGRLSGDDPRVVTLVARLSDLAEDIGQKVTRYIDEAEGIVLDKDRRTRTEQQCDSLRADIEDRCESLHQQTMDISVDASDRIANHIMSL